ncbi:hypothetical protein EDB19DRAFT_1781345 [Suillus lakei]|nr:hypothetical protein EDB19DRAFT_1781345 [Suillus lakei]
MQPLLVQALLIPRQVFPNIIAASVLCRHSDLPMLRQAKYCATSMPRQCHVTSAYMPRHCPTKPTPRVSTSPVCQLRFAQLIKNATLKRHPVSNLRDIPAPEGFNVHGIVYSRMVALMCTLWTL